jgi:hypothetical protein
MGTIKSATISRSGPLQHSSPHAPNYNIDSFCSLLYLDDRKIQLKKRDTIKLCLLGCQLYHEILEVYAKNMIQRNQIEDLSIMKVAKKHLEVMELKEMVEEQNN